MAWREKLLDGSFRGVTFKFEAHDATVGRRTEVHQYPGRDNPYVEDLGQNAGVWNLEVFVIGPDYYTARDALIDALNKAGPGELIHPYLGKKTVAVTDASLSESMEEGGMARFRITFTQTTEPVYPAAKTDTAATARAKGDAAKQAAADSFSSRLGGYLKTAANYVSRATGLLSGGLVNGVLDFARQYLPVGQIVGSVATLYQAGQSLTSLISNPGGFASGLTGIFGNWGTLFSGVFTASNQRGLYQAAALVGLQAAGGWGAALTPANPTALADVQAAVGTAPTPALAVQAVRQAVADGLAVVIPSADVRVQGGATISANMALLIVCIAELAAFARRLALCEEAIALTQFVWDNYADAAAARDSLAARLQAEADRSDDAVARALRELRTAVQVDITARAADLSRISSYTPRRTEPACLIAWRIYGDATRDEEIIAHNHLSHGGFVPGGYALEVLADG